MTGPFESRHERSGGFGTRLLGRKARGEAAREIEALLAGSTDIGQVTAGDVQTVAERHGVDMSRLQSTCRDLYRRYLEFCLVDRAISSSEASDLAHLRSILQLDEIAAAEVQEEVSCAVYGAAIDEVLADHRLEAEEEAFLKTLRSELGLAQEVAQQAFEEGRRRARQRYLSTVVSSDDVLVVSQEIKLELEGTSETSIEDAVGDALEEALTVLPNLRQVEVTSLRGEIADGRVTQWRVKLRTILDKGA